MTAPYIFISHSTQDKDFAQSLNDSLQQAGFPTWFDTVNIPDGSTWAREIERGVVGCGALLVVMSEKARESEWVERETLLAMELRKPIFIALIEGARLPIHLINRQYTDFRARPEAAAKRLIAALKKISLTEPLPEVTKPLEAAKFAPEPNQMNFFKYLKQLPDGDQAAEIARELFNWAGGYGLIVRFGGKITPGFHARVPAPSREVTAFSVWAYSRRPAVEVPFDYWKSISPYDERQLRLSTLDALNRLMPDSEKFDDDKADRRPNLPLFAALGQPGALAEFKHILHEIIDNLRS